MRVAIEKGRDPGQAGAWIPVEEEQGEGKLEDREGERGAAAGPGALRPGESRGAGPAAEVRAGPQDPGLVRRPVDAGQGRGGYVGFGCERRVMGQRGPQSVGKLG